MGSNKERKAGATLSGVQPRVEDAPPPSDARTEEGGRKVPAMTRIKQLGIGSRFYLPDYPIDDPNAVWEVIGRARKTGGNTPDESAYYVHVRSVARKDPSKEDHLPRYFDVEKEVVEVAKARKTVFAIDRRDQPEDVETIDDIAQREGVNIPGDE